jgi:hypothetical protein
MTRHPATTTVGPASSHDATDDFVVIPPANSEPANSEPANNGTFQTALEHEQGKRILKLERGFKKYQSDKKRLEENIQNLRHYTIFIVLVFLIMGLNILMLSGSDAARATLYGIIICACAASLVLLELEDAQTLLRPEKSPKAIKHIEKPEAPAKPASPNLESQATSASRVSRGGQEASTKGQQHLVPVSAGKSTCRKLRLSDYVRR